MNTVAPFKVDNLSSKHFEDIEYSILQIEQAMMLHTDIYDLRDVIERKLKEIKHDLAVIKGDSTTL
ncbi:MAG TPA: hypothetical protein VKZ44_01285 [Taishania sp.]|nr:hypothetical protein [Taishania sp.]